MNNRVDVWEYVRAQALGDAKGDTHERCQNAKNSVLQLVGSKLAPRQYWYALPDWMSISARMTVISRYIAQSHYVAITL